MNEGREERFTTETQRHGEEKKGILKSVIGHLKLQI
jgi:hypothetical protein